MVENGEKVFCTFYPNKTPGGYCPEDCPARFYCASIKSAIVQENTETRSQTAITKELAIKISRRPYVREILRKLIDSGIVPNCRKAK